MSKKPTQSANLEIRKLSDNEMSTIAGGVEEFRDGCYMNSETLDYRNGNGGIRGWWWRVRCM